MCTFSEQGISHMYFARWPLAYTCRCFLQHDEKSPSERESDEHWKDVAALLWHGQIEAFSEEEQLAIAKSLKTACPIDMTNFLNTGGIPSLYEPTWTAAGIGNAARH